VTLEIFKYPVVTQSAWTVFPPSLETGLKHYSHWNNIQCTLVDIYTIKQCEKYVAKLTSLEKCICCSYFEIEKIIVSGNEHCDIRH